MNVKLKKRMTGTFEDLEQGDMFRNGGYAICMKTERTKDAYSGVINAVSSSGVFLFFNEDDEVEVIHGAFVEEGADT